MNTTLKKCSAAISLALLSATVATQTQASGFALIENSASGLGNAYAGAAAIAEDASTIWFNPAGMTKLSGSSLLVAGHIIAPKSDFTNSNSTLFDGNPISGTGNDAGVTKLVPNLYYVTKVNEDITFGIGFTAPFGLETDYGDQWTGRYHATKSEMLTLNINPAFAFKASDKLSIGVGFNYQYIDVTLDNQIDSGQVCTTLMYLNPASPTAGNVSNSQSFCATNVGLVVGNIATDSSQSLSGTDWSWGVNFGVLYDFTDMTRLGVAYRSGVNHDVTGNVDFKLNANLDAMITNDLFSDSAVVAHTELPDTLSFSFVHSLDSDLTLLADATLTRWSSFDELKIRFLDTSQSPSVTPENWVNSWRFAVGANYKASDKLIYRVGVALDQTPVSNAQDRTPRIPDNDRKWLSLGVGYALNTEMSVDIGYSHLFISDTGINNANSTRGVLAHTLNGTYNSTVDIISAQLNMKF